MSKIKSLPSGGLFKCYIDGKFYKTALAYLKDLEHHVLDGSYEKALEPNTKENRRYIYNFRLMNGHFRPNEISKSESIQLWKHDTVNKMLSKLRKVNNN